MNANWRSTATPNVVYLHRATLLDEDVTYPIDTELGQGRHATNPVPSVSMFAGKPAFDYEADLSHEDWLWRRRQLVYVLAANFIALGSMGLLLYFAWQTGG